MTGVYRFRRFKLSPATRHLLVDNQPVPLGARAFDVLTALIERRERLVSKNELLDLVWPGLVVEENNLQVQISALRKLLGQDAIATVTGLGYRFALETEQDIAEPPILAVPTNNLPQQITSFIGRERELAEVKQLLAQYRLVTLTGVGGIGKTRLSLQVAAEVRNTYPDGVWLVEFGPISDQSLVLTSVAQVLGVKEATGVPLVQTLCSHLKSRHLLMMFDSCEHLTNACATLADALLRATDNIRILVSSQNPLQIGGEQRFPLPPLSLPDLDADPERLLGTDAVRLFVERARSQKPDFVVTERQARTVAEICARLDGIPLALELAAARVPLLSIEHIQARLNDRFKLLTGGVRTALPRQQTLRATLEWSYGLLSEEERNVLNRLAIFPGSFTVDAAASVVCEDVIDEFAVIDLLGQLVARSLVVVDATDIATRYRLLETTRAYALEKLAEGREAGLMARRHAQYFRDLLRPAPSDQMRMSNAAWRATYLPELDNVRAALDWALGSGGDPALGISLSGASGAMWPELALLGEGRQRLAAAVAQVGSDTLEQDQAQLWHGVGLQWSHNTPAQAVAAFEHAASLYRRLGDGLGLGRSLLSLGMNLMFMGRLDQAATVLAEAFPVLERASLPKALARYFDNLGFLSTLSGDLASARKHYEKALMFYRDTAAERDSLDTLGNLADVTWALGDLDAALSGCRQTIAILREPPPSMRATLGRNLLNLSGILTERGELNEALTAAREGLPLLKEMDSAWRSLDHVALRAALAGKLANAARLAGFVDSANAAKESPRQPNEARARDRLQVLLREELSPDELERLFAEGAMMTEEQSCRLALEE